VAAVGLDEGVFDALGLEPVYWPSTESVAVVSVFETDDQGALMEIGLTWGDMFQLETEDGLRLGAAAMGRRPA